MEVSGKRTKPDEGNAFSTMDELCVLCKWDNVVTRANGFCKECEEIMCSACFRKHLRLKACQNHTLLDTVASSEETDITGNVEDFKCKIHTGETVKYYCRKHEAVACGDCIVSNHMVCKPEFIKDLSDNYPENEEYKTFMRTIEKLISERKDFDKNIQESRKKNKEMLQKALGDIKQFRLDINKHLDKAEEDITCQIKNIMEENGTLLSKLENDCMTLSSKLEEITSMLNSELYNDYILFIHNVECKPKITESEKAISDMKSRSMKKYEFVHDQQLRGAVASAQNLGTLTISSFEVCHQTTDRANEKSISQVNADESAEDTYKKEQITTESGYKKEKSGVRSVVAVGARVQDNWVRGTGTVTDVHDDGEVTVKWYTGRSGRCRIGAGRFDVTIIKS